MFRDDKKYRLSKIIGIGAIILIIILYNCKNLKSIAVYEAEKSDLQASISSQEQEDTGSQAETGTQEEIDTQGETGSEQGTDSKEDTDPTDTEEAPQEPIYIDITGATVSNISNQQYTGKNIQPTVTVQYNKAPLTKETDYTVTYSNNKNVGTATVTITGIGEYTGTITKTFKITQKSISKFKCSTNLSYYTYIGKNIEAGLHIYDGSTELKKNRDYTVEYKNNKNTGKATATVKGKGNYTDTLTKTFIIAPAKAKINSIILNAKFTQATITWTKDTQASGYRIYMSESKNGTYESVKYISSKNTTKYVVKGLNPNKTYYFKIKAFKTIDGKNKYSKYYSDAKTNTALLAEITLTSSSSGANRNTNLKLASKAINGLVLKPGQTFNWFKVVGSASKAKGYKQAIIFSNGKSVYGYGGGVCQVSTTVYQASVKAGLKIVERHTHSKAVTYTTKGKDATVSYGAKNLRIKNNKKYSIRFVTTSNKGSTTCKIYKVN